MKPSEADAIAQAILTRDPAEQEALRLERARQAQWRSEQRNVAGPRALPVFVAGAVVAHVLDDRWVVGGLVGNLLGAGVAWIWISMRNRHLKSVSRSDP
ncbi:hypothetical protein GDR29_20685 [Xanthomonas oryzae pv. oryzae]|nr:hypothetical protein GDR29_20685 [Xanthomonas oryzae pv. oryzae]